MKLVEKRKLWKLFLSLEFRNKIERSNGWIIVWSSSCMLLKESRKSCQVETKVFIVFMSEKSAYLLVVADDASRKTPKTCENHCKRATVTALKRHFNIILKKKHTHTYAIWLLFIKKKTNAHTETLWQSFLMNYESSYVK